MSRAENTPMLGVTHTPNQPIQGQVRRCRKGFQARDNHTVSITHVVDRNMRYGACRHSCVLQSGISPCKVSISAHSSGQAIGDRQAEYSNIRGLDGETKRNKHACLCLHYNPMSM